MKKFFVIVIVFLIATISGCGKKTVLLESKNYLATNFYSEWQNEQLSEKQLEVVQKYAPHIYQETNIKKNPEDWDFITSFDFDGDLRGNNNEESLRSGKYPLPATVYYALVETETHYFLSYSFFHPLDWSTTSPYIPFFWHENDMENIQIVVQKARKNLKERPILLSTQAHLDTALSVGMNTGIKSGKKKLEEKTFKSFNENFEQFGSHPAVYVEWGGHGIHSITNKADRFSSLVPPKLKEGMVFIPSPENRPDYYQKEKSNYRYQLVSTHDTFWNFYKNRVNIGNGKLLDGSFDYKDKNYSFSKLPRFFDSDRVSAPGKSDSGILPFAFSFSLTSSDLGILFFLPAGKYLNSLEIGSEWSTNYTYNPYLNKPTAIASAE